MTPAPLGTAHKAKKIAQSPRQRKGCQPWKQKWPGSEFCMQQCTMHDSDELLFTPQAIRTTKLRFRQRTAADDNRRDAAHGCSKSRAWTSVQQSGIALQMTASALYYQGCKVSTFPPTKEPSTSTNAISHTQKGISQHIIHSTKLHVRNTR
jgi:hypothetical protein